MIAKSVQGLLATGVPPAETLRQAALFGARNRDGWGIGLTILTAVGNLLPLLLSPSSKGNRSISMKIGQLHPDDGRRTAIASNRMPL